MLAVAWAVRADRPDWKAAPADAADGSAGAEADAASRRSGPTIMRVITDCARHG